ncbi:MAG: hypothetical protein HQM09_07145 [Candidatus Riflebacteria bacterium]|nr:hypothetical protein [Candidatus Riflebacteria bacterium]
MATVRSIFWVAYYGFLEALRNKFLLGMFCLAVPLTVSSWLLDTYQLGFQVKIVKDISLNVISGFGLLIVFLMSLDQIIPDIERRSVYFILSRLPDRLAYLLGRFLGVAATLFFYHSLFAFFLIFLLKFHDNAWFWEILPGAFVVFLKQCCLLSIIMMLATWTTKIVVISCGTMIYVVGHSFEIMRMLAEKNGSFPARIITEGLAFLIPNFSLFEMRVLVVHEIPLRAEAVGLLFLYSVFVVAFFLSLGGWSLSRRDL